MKPIAPIYSPLGETKGKKELDASVFGVSINMPLVHQSLVSFLANGRPVVAHTKDRSEVRGGGRKPWRQKGTGNARAGSTRSPLWRGGGITFGPINDRNWKKRLPTKMRQGAFRSALSSKVASDQLVVIDSFSSIQGKTKHWADVVAKLPNPSLGHLVVEHEFNPTVDQSIRNHTSDKYTTINELTIYDLIHYPILIISTEALDALTDRLKRQTEIKPKATV